jgi:acetoin utilization deacetylase AcuC-like enzyme
MGFCFYNNVAVAAAYLKTVYKTKGIRKILILDW